jgi:hypothetical protein
MLGLGQMGQWWSPRNLRRVGTWPLDVARSAGIPVGPVPD